MLSCLLWALGMVLTSTPGHLLPGLLRFHSTKMWCFYSVCKGTPVQTPGALLLHCSLLSVPPRLSLDDLVLKSPLWFSLPKPTVQNCLQADCYSNFRAHLCYFTFISWIEALNCCQFWKADLYILVLLFAVYEEAKFIACFWCGWKRKYSAVFLYSLTFLVSPHLLLSWLRSGLWFCSLLYRFPTYPNL